MVKMSACRAVTEWVRLPYRPQMFASLAQLAERHTCNVQVIESWSVGGSNWNVAQRQSKTPLRLRSRYRNSPFQQILVYGEKAITKHC